MATQRCHCQGFHEGCQPCAPGSLNTEIQSAMERLFRKVLANRKKVSHSFRFSASGQGGLLGNLINDVVGRFSSDSHSLLRRFSTPPSLG